MCVCCCPHCQHVWRGRRVAPLNLSSCAFNVWRWSKWSVVCVSESDCQSQFSVGCRRSGKDQFVSVELFVKTPRLQHVCRREEECLPVWCFLTTFPVWRGGGSEGGDWQAEQWSVCPLPFREISRLIGLWLWCFFLAVQVISFITCVSFLIGRINCECPAQPSDWQVECNRRL